MFKGTGWYVTDYSQKLKEKKTESNGDKKPKKDPAAGTPAAPKKSQDK